MTPTHVCEVIVTGPTGTLLPDLGRELVAARLAASANTWTSPVESVYWWQGQMQTTQEARMHLLTRANLVTPLTAFIRERHPYEVPNITAIPVIAGNPEFVDWILSETRDLAATD